MPGLPVDLPAMCDKDKVDIRWGIQNNVDYIAASFVRKASDVTEIRNYTAALRKEMYVLLLNSAWLYYVQLKCRIHPLCCSCNHLGFLTTWAKVNLTSTYH